MPACYRMCFSVWCDLWPQDGDKEELGLAEVERGMALYRKIKHGIVKPDPPPNIVVDGVKCGKQLVHVVEEEATLITVAQRLNMEVKTHLIVDPNTMPTTRMITA